MNAITANLDLKAFALSSLKETLVITTDGIVKFGELMAHSYLEHVAQAKKSAR